MQNFGIYEIPSIFKTFALNDVSMTGAKRQYDVFWP